MYCQTVRENVFRILETTEASVSFAQVPKQSTVTRIKFGCFFHIRNSFIPAALSTVDGSQRIPDLGVVRCREVSDSELSPGQLVIPISVVIIISQGNARIPQIRLQAHRIISRKLSLGETRPAAVVAKPIQFAVNPGNQAERKSELRIALNCVAQQSKGALTVFTRIP